MMMMLIMLMMMMMMFMMTMISSSMGRNLRASSLIAMANLKYIWLLKQALGIAGKKPFQIKQIYFSLISMVYEFEMFLDLVS